MAGDHLDLAIAQLGAAFHAVDQLAQHLARFHDGMPANERIACYGSPDEILRNVTQNFSQTRDTIGTYLTDVEARELEAKQLGFVEQRRSLLEERMWTGRVRDGHGDLRLEHVYISLEQTDDRLRATLPTWPDRLTQ